MLTTADVDHCVEIADRLGERARLGKWDAAEKLLRKRLGEVPTTPAFARAHKTPSESSIQSAVVTPRAA